MSDNNEFGYVPAPDTPEAYQAAAAAEQSEVPASETDDIEGEASASDVVVPTPAPVPAAPVAPVATPAPAVDKVTEAKTPIHGLHEDANALGLEGEALLTKRKLAAEPKVRMMIPLDPGERVGAYRTVIINGYRFDVKKNVMVDLPQSVAALLADSYRITSETLEDNNLNLSKPENERRRAALGM